MKPSKRCEELIKNFEGYGKELPDGIHAYPDPGTGGVPWTIGYGSTGRDIKKGTIWTKEQAEERFRTHVAKFGREVRALLGSAPTTQNQFDALVSFAYNLGSGNLASSTLLKKHKAQDYVGAAAQFKRWNKAAGKVLRGLTRRREAEAKLYMEK